MSEQSERGREKRRRFLSVLKPQKEEGLEIKHRQARVIGVFSCKGGVGKTTTAANVSAYLNQRMKDDVLAVDANLTAPNLGIHLGELTPRTTIHDVLAGEVKIEKAVMKCHGIPVLLGSIAFGEEVHLVDLQAHLAPLKSKYKVIVLDSSPGIGPEVVAAMKACDEILVVTNPLTPTIASTLKTFGAADRYKIHVLGSVINMVRKEPFELSIDDVRRALGWPVLASVPEDPKVREATIAGVPVLFHDADSPASQSFAKLGRSIMKYLGKI
ncbi:MAG: MinD/ParA family protein [Candidatus Hadarchaeota archaeon]